MQVAEILTKSVHEQSSHFANSTIVSTHCLFWHHLFQHDGHHNGLLALNLDNRSFTMEKSYSARFSIDINAAWRKA